jgi:hypothetical protein
MAEEPSRSGGSKPINEMAGRIESPAEISPAVKMLQVFIGVIDPDSVVHSELRRSSPLPAGEINQREELSFVESHFLSISPETSFRYSRVRDTKPGFHVPCVFPRFLYMPDPAAICQHCQRSASLIGSPPEPEFNWRTVAATFNSSTCDHREDSGSISHGFSLRNSISEGISRLVCLSTGAPLCPVDAPGGHVFLGRTRGTGIASFLLLE